MKRARRRRAQLPPLRGLAIALRCVSADEMRAVSVKRARLDLRVAPVEKAQIGQMARRLGLPVAVYLLQLHRLAVRRLSRLALSRET